MNFYFYTLSLNHSGSTNAAPLPGGALPAGQLSAASRRRGGLSQNVPG